MYLDTPAIFVSHLSRFSGYDIGSLTDLTLMNYQADIDNGQLKSKSIPTNTSHSDINIEERLSSMVKHYLDLNKL